ncbi:MAG: four helix bundle suffix domain-containing protein [Candidatus Marinimicrobia bacterium]|nr:four helix bundle suffix domain-containing protein [Candidatus Neomarinimicrobiota bacterium]
MSQIFNKSGGYRKLLSFNFATIIHLGTVSFCKRFIDWKQDPLGKTLGQMMGASRSGKQNIIEGSERARTSTETEIKLTDVAKASLAELLGDLEDFLAARDEIPWSIHAKEHQALSAIQLAPFEYTDDVLHDYWIYLHGEKKKFAPWLDNESAVVVANALNVLVQRALALLGKQLQSQEAAFLQSGGIRERMTQARVAARDPAAPDCPDCGKPMRRRTSRKGDFWGCSGYPDCRAILDIGKVTTTSD